VMACTYNPSSKEAEEGGCKFKVSQRLYSKTLSQKKKTQKWNVVCNISKFC
jgi:hypothetical protein